MEKRKGKKNVVNNDKKKKVISIIQIIFVIIIICTLVRIGMWYVNSNKEAKLNNNLNEEVLTIYEDRNNTNVDNSANTLEVSVDFEKLKQINSDIKGWIKIENTNINYPILQGSDNDYYLYRNYMKEKNQSGSIYLNSKNNGFIDKNTVIYGHNMKDGTMFYDLYKIYNNELGNDITVYIYTPDGHMKYKVVSTYIINPDEFKYEYDINELIKKSKFSFENNIKEDSKILTLYTCNHIGDKRLIVHAIKI